MDQISNSQMESVRRVVKEEIKELNKKRDENLLYKLDALEKYFNLYMSTRSEAMSIAVTRIQGDSTVCLRRCTEQVREFYEEIGRIKENIISLKEKFIQAEKVDDKNEIDEKEDKSKILLRVEALEKWRYGNIERLLIWGAAAILALIQIIEWIKVKPPVH